MRKDVANLWNLVEPFVGGAGCELVELEWSRETGGWVLRLYIDRPVATPAIPTGSEANSNGAPPAVAAMAPVDGDGPTNVSGLPGFASPSGLSDPAAVDVLPPVIGHEDCERVSRDVSAGLDVANTIAHAYRLEVSSPGLDRPLRRERDFVRFAGNKVRVKTSDAFEGRRNFSGILLGAQSGAVDLDCDGRRFRLPVVTIVRANLVPDWAAEFRRAERSAS